MDVRRSVRWLLTRALPQVLPRRVAGDRGPEHRSILVIDICGFGRWRNREQLRARAALRDAVRTSFRASGIARSRLAVEDRGDGMIVLIHASVSKLDLIDPLIPRLAMVIRHHNATVEPGGRIRLRVSVHAGEVHRDVSGWAGTDLNLACRLVNDQAVYQRLQQAPQADLVLVVTEVIQHGVIQHGYRRIDPASYVPVRVAVKEVNTRAWIHTPLSAAADIAPGTGHLPHVMVNSIIAS